MKGLVVGKKCQHKNGLEKIRFVLWVESLHH